MWRSLLGSKHSTDTGAARGSVRVLEFQTETPPRRPARSAISLGNREGNEARAILANFVRELVLFAKLKYSPFSIADSARSAMFSRLPQRRRKQPWLLSRS